MAEAFGRLPAPIQKTVWGLVLLVAAIGPAFLMFGLLNRTIAAGIALYYTLAALSATSPLLSRPGVWARQSWANPSSFWLGAR